MAPHSSTLAWEIPWMEESGRLQSMGSLRVGHDWATSLSRIGEGNGNPLQCSCLENPRDGGAWRAAISGVAQSRTRLTRLSSSSSTCKGFPGSSVGKESTCNAVNPGSIPGWGRFPGEGIGYPLQDSWAFLVAQKVKYLPAMWETWIWSLDWEDPLERACQPTPVFLPGKSTWTEEPCGFSPWDLEESDLTD